ncbi:hypothetical protein BVRB_8g184170 [Beta vulgaris subsp. vulgaris]|nr:hypothetical protein BVRB_8g184170 [Beta vulgaris subsp. vulgaris]
MATNSSHEDPTPTTKNPVTTTATLTIPASVSKLQPISQPRTPLFLQHHPQIQHSFQHHPQPVPFTAPTSIQSQTQPIRYPLASSGRGILPTIGCTRPNSSQHQQYQHQSSAHLLLRPLNAHISPAPAVARPIPLNNPPQSKAGSSPYFIADSSDSKDPLDKGTDDMLVTLRDRKVRITDGASFYALCRSWLRNGYVEENQPQYGDIFSRSLPKPLPLPESFSPKRKECDDETEVDEAEKLGNAEELLSMHVRRAKRVRTRLREERLQRIERYKSRLGLLLHPPNGTTQE